MDKGSRHFYASVLIHCGICCLTALALALRETKTRKPSIFKRFTGLFSLLPFSSVCRSDHAPADSFKRFSALLPIIIHKILPRLSAQRGNLRSVRMVLLTLLDIPPLAFFFIWVKRQSVSCVILAHFLCNFFQCRPLMRIACASGSSAFYTACYIFKGSYLPYTVINRLAFGFFGQCRNKHICGKVAVIYRLAFCFIRKYCLLFCCRRFLCCGFFLFFSITAQHFIGQADKHGNQQYYYWQNVKPL
ncbi:Uncharacterised protein [Neisseria meningitidis]|nr:Uncharacterised protein [Neisseria meningitidis]